VLHASVQIVEPVLIAETKACGTDVYVPIAVTLMTSDGALTATVTGYFSRHEHPVHTLPGETVHADDFVPTPWRASASCALNEARGSVDLRLREAWARAAGRGKRFGLLSLDLELDAAGVTGRVGARLAYAADAHGISSSEGPAFFNAPVVGIFPFAGAAPSGPASYGAKAKQ
jgi:hypothetical protein